MDFNKDRMEITVHGSVFEAVFSKEKGFEWERLPSRHLHQWSKSKKRRYPLGYGRSREGHELPRAIKVTENRKATFYRLTGRRLEVLDPAEIPGITRAQKIHALKALIEHKHRRRASLLRRQRELENELAMAVFYTAIRYLELHDFVEREVQG